MKEKIVKQAGTALLITLLLAGAISAIAFGMTKITLNEVFVGMKGQEGLEAQYAAQAGVEDALMRYKFHDKTSLEMPDRARGGTNGTNNVVRVYLNRPLVTNVPASNRPSANADDYYYDLKVWHKQECPPANPLEYNIKKDESISLDTSSITGSINVTWNLYNADNRLVISLPQDEARKTALWYRLSDPSHPGQIDPTGQNRDFFTMLSYFNLADNTPNLTFSGLAIPRGVATALSTRSAKSLKFKAFISDLNRLNGAYIKITITSTSEEVGGPKTYIESTGHYGDTAKKIEVTVDRENKSIIDVFDYVIYSGQGSLPR